MAVIDFREISRLAELWGIRDVAPELSLEDCSDSESHGRQVWSQVNRLPRSLAEQIRRSVFTDGERPIRVTVVAPVFLMGGAEQWIASLCWWLDPDRARVNRVIVTAPNATDPVSVEWLPRSVELVQCARELTAISSDMVGDVVVTWGLRNLSELVGDLRVPVIDVQHGVELSDAWQWPLVQAVHRAAELPHVSFAAVNELCLQNYSSVAREKMAVIENGADPRRCLPLSSPLELRHRHGIHETHQLALYLGRVGAGKNWEILYELADALPSEWRVAVIGPNYTGGERLPKHDRVIRVPTVSHPGTWLAAADVLVHPSDFESHCYSINEAWLAGLPVVSTDYPVNRQFQRRHGKLMEMVRVRPEASVLRKAVLRASESGRRGIVAQRAKDMAERRYSAHVSAAKWLTLLESKVDRQSSR